MLEMNENDLHQKEQMKKAPINNKQIKKTTALYRSNLVFALSHIFSGVLFNFYSFLSYGN